MEDDHKKINRCLACGDEKFITLIFQKDNFEFYRCLKCEHTFIDISHCDTSSIYSKDYFCGTESGFGYVDYDTDKEPMKPVFEEYIRRIEKSLFKKNGNLLDIGAATGVFIEVAGKCGWNAVGIEISDYAADKGKGKGLTVLCCELKDCNFEDERFDAITMWDVLEHLQDPASDMRIIFRLLKHGGIFAINTPDSGSLYARILRKKWHLYVPPEHVNYFTKKSIALFLNKNGFYVEEIVKIGKIFTLEYIFHIIAKWTNFHLFERMAVFLKRHPRIGTIGMPLNLRDNMFVIARKKENK